MSGALSDMISITSRVLCGQAGGIWIKPNYICWIKFIAGSSQTKTTKGQAKCS